MTTIRSTATRPASTPAVTRSLETAARLFATVWNALRNRRQVRRIADLDDYLLADIGLTRADVQAASAMPIYTDPTARLAVTARNEWTAMTMPQARPRRGRGGY